MMPGRRFEAALDREDEPSHRDPRRHETSSRSRRCAIFPALDQHPLVPHTVVSGDGFALSLAR
jgi:hypothetical protein